MVAQKGNANRNHLSFRMAVLWSAPCFQSKHVRIRWTKPSRGLVQCGSDISRLHMFTTISPTKFEEVTVNQFHREDMIHVCSRIFYIYMMSIYTCRYIIHVIQWIKFSPHCICSTCGSAIMPLSSPMAKPKDRVSLQVSSKRTSFDGKLPPM